MADACSWLGANLDSAREWGQAGRRVAELLSWDHVIERLLGMKVAYYSPLPPERSGVADYSAMLLPELQQRLEIDVVRRGARRRAAVLPARQTSRSTTSATTRSVTGGSSKSCAGARAWSSCTTSSSTT